MTTTTTTPRAIDAHPIELALLGLLALGLALKELAAGLIALTGAAAGYGATRARAAAPAAVPATAAPAPAAVHPLGERLAMFGQLPVKHLRVLAREAGHRQLARSGRRADLLAALGAI